MAIPTSGIIRRLEAAASAIASAPARFEKDILRVGNYVVDTIVKGVNTKRPWIVDRAKILQIAEDFNRITKAGNTVPVQWDHSLSARDRIGDVIALEPRENGDVLYAIFDAKHSGDAEKIGVTANEVSVELREPWTDGAGNTYQAALTHLGVVNLPVVTNQGPVVRLSLISGETPMAKEEETTDGADDTMIPVKDVVAMLREAGKSVPDEVKTANDLKLAWKVLNPSASAEKKDEEGKPSSTSADDLINAASPAIQASVKGKDEEIIRLRSQLAEVEKRDEATYTAEVEALVTRGSLTAVDRENVLAVGKLSKWSLTTLAPFQRIKAGSAVKTESHTRRLSTGVAANDSADEGMTKEKAKTLAKEIFAN